MTPGHFVRGEAPLLHPPDAWGRDATDLKAPIPKVVFLCMSSSVLTQLGPAILSAMLRIKGKSTNGNKMSVTLMPHGHNLKGVQLSFLAVMLNVS